MAQKITTSFMDGPLSYDKALMLTTSRYKLPPPSYISQISVTLLLKHTVAQPQIFNLDLRSAPKKGWMGAMFDILETEMDLQSKKLSQI